MARRGRGKGLEPRIPTKPAAPVKQAVTPAPAAPVVDFSKFTTNGSMLGSLPEAVIPPLQMPVAPPPVAVAPPPPPVAPAPAPVPIPQIDPAVLAQIQQQFNIPAPAPAPAPVAVEKPVEKPVENNWTKQKSWLDEEPTFNDNRQGDNTGKTAVLTPIRRMNKDGYSTGWDATPAELQRQKEFDAREQERRYQPRDITPRAGATPTSTHRGNFKRTTLPVRMNEERPPVAIKPPVNTGGMGSNAMEDAKIPTLRDNPLFTGSGKDFGVPKGSNQERLQREESNKQEEESAKDFEDIYAGHDWMNDYGTRNKPFWEQSNAENPFARKSFIQMIFNEFGDMLRKADPHVAGLLAMRIYMDKFMR